MERTELLKLAEQVLRIPTAPYHEQGVRAFVEEYCRGLGLRVERDRVGNVVVQYQRGRARAPLVYMAHMDHPGFESLGGSRAGSKERSRPEGRSYNSQAEFLGGVPQECFPGSRVRFYVDGKVVRARVTRIEAAHWPQRKLVGIESAAPLRQGDFGMWDVPAFRISGDKLQATTIDDVLSVAVVLATLSEVARRRLETQVWGVFTRAEEVGFHGAVEIARSGRIPRQSLIISMEMSKTRPWALIGDGPIIRVGDRLTSFDADGLYFLREVARQSTIRAQRCLMDGGACEATALLGFGYRACGLCLPLGNYHNIGPRQKIRAEFVSVRDLEGLLQLTVAAARDWKKAATVRAGLRKQVELIRAKVPRELND